MAAGEITIRTVQPVGLSKAAQKTYKHPGLSVTCWMGDEPPTVTGGYGGWEIVNRPRRDGMTLWRGRQPIQMDIAIVLDDFKSGEEIESRISNLERMAQPYLKEPPIVKIPSSAVPHNDLDWVINNIVWGAAVRKSNGDRIRQEATISLVSYVPPDKIKLSPAQQTRNKAGRV